MRDPRRIGGLIALLREAWQESPDLRLGQLLTAIHSKQALDESAADLFDLEDEDWETRILRFIEDARAF